MTKLSSHFKPSRRRFLQATGVAVAAPTIFLQDAWAQGKEITISIWGGAQGEFIKKNVIPAFEKDFGCRVLAEDGFTLVNMQKIRATKSNPKYTVMFMDDIGIAPMKAENLIDPLPADKMPNLTRLFPRFLYEGGYGTALGISSVAMLYNTTQKPPESFAELWDPKYKGNIKLNSWKNTGGLCFLIATAAVLTGKPLKEAQYEVDKIWDKLAAIKPNVQNLYVSGVEAANEVAQGQAMVAGPDLSKFIYPLTAKGVPVDMAFMKEGSFTSVNCQVLVKGGPNQDVGVAFMNRMLSPDVQKALGEYALVAPPVAGIDFKPETLKYITYPDTKMDSIGLFTPDWTFVNKNLSAWTEKTNQIFS